VCTAGDAQFAGFLVVKGFDCQGFGKKAHPWEAMLHVVVEAEEEHLLCFIPAAKAAQPTIKVSFLSGQRC
jgi:hypothetical protein